jgi:hypothetical protein
VEDPAFVFGNHNAQTERNKCRLAVELENFEGLCKNSTFLDNAPRAEMTVSCRDCDLIPKVPDSGKVISFEGKPAQIMHNGLRVVAGATMATGDAHHRTASWTPQASGRSRLS